MEFQKNKQIWRCFSQDSIGSNVEKPLVHSTQLLLFKHIALNGLLSSS